MHTNPNARASSKISKYTAKTQQREGQRECLQLIR